MAVNPANVSSTAKLTAYMRQYSDIPFAKDVAQHLRAREAFEALLRGMQIAPEDFILYAPIFEVRYKSIAEMVRRSGVNQVLELASGFSLRGLAMTRDPAITYVESDLEDLTREKTALVADLQRQYDLTRPGNYRLSVADALDRAQLQAAVEHFRRDRAIAVVHEGLLLYLSPSEMATVAQNIRDLLAEYGGVWITPDFSLKEDIRNATSQQREFRRIIAAATDKQLFNNAFDDSDQVRSFFGGLGLHSLIVNQVDIAPTIVSLETLDIPRRMLEEARPGLKLWVLEPARA